MKRDQRGVINIFVILFGLTTLLFIGAAAFGVWAYGSRSDFKNNVEQKIAAAVGPAVQQAQAQQLQNDQQAAKNPLATYAGPSDFGSVIIKYPKTWSAYVDVENNGGTPLNGYFDPGVVPSITDQTNAFALRVQVLSQAYDQTLQQYNSQVQQGQVTVTPYSLPLVPNVVGVLINGQIQPTKQGSMVMLPLRNETLELWTEATQYENDFTSNILPNFTFSP